MKEHVKKFKDSMQKIADESQETISISGGGSPETVIAKPKESDEVSKIKINKFKYNRKTNEVQVNYQQIMPHGMDDINIELKSQDKPLQTLVLLMDSLVKFVSQICQLPDEYCKDAEIRSVSFSHTKDILGAVMTALIPLDSANSPVVINTPHLPSEQYSATGNSPILSKECVDTLILLQAEIEAYIKGDREIEISNQLELNLE
jgi:hypothetical protein